MRASWAPDSGAWDSASSAAYCGTDKPNGFSARCLAAIRACSERLTKVPSRVSRPLAMTSSTPMPPHSPPGAGPAPRGAFYQHSANHKIPDVHQAWTSYETSYIVVGGTVDPRKEQCAHG